MKDYRLSEIIAECKKQKNCSSCPCCDFCEYVDVYSMYPAEWENVEPRDMIELPCKQALDIDNKVYQWEVIYRGKNGLIYFNMFGTEAEADAFLNKLLQKAQQLKGDKE